MGWLAERRSWEADFPVPIRAGRVDTSEIAVSGEPDYGTSDEPALQAPKARSGR